MFFFYKLFLESPIIICLELNILIICFISVDLLFFKYTVKPLLHLSHKYFNPSSFI